MTDSDRPGHSVVAEKILDYISLIIFYTVALLFISISLLLIVLAVSRLIVTAMSIPDIRLDTLFEAIGFTTVAAAVFELAKTMYEEEIKGKGRINAPRKTRRFLSRFLTVIVISLAIEFLTMVFRYSHKPDEFVFLYAAAAVAIGVSALFISWAIFNRLSIYIEKWDHELIMESPRGTGAIDENQD